VQAAAKPKLLESPAAVRWLTIAALIVLWEVCARAFGDPSFVAPPSKVIVALLPTIFGDPKLTAALGMTFFELVAAFFLSIVVGAVVGVAIGTTDLARRSFFPFVLLLYGLPQVALLPLCILMYGLGPPSRIAFGFTHGVLPIIVTTVSGMRAVSPLLLASARSLGASKGQILRHILFPTMLASVFTGLRLAMSLTLLGVILAELYVSSNGIGSFTQIFAETFKPAQLYSLVVVLAIMAVIVNELVGLVETHFSRWKQG
jgi:ABC-type nitrate/sulfonate/bicarbonate transport system permease component